MDDQFTDWHSVRPWKPSLSLSVREITSVSVTFILSSPYSAPDAANQDPSLISLGLSSSDDDDQSRDSASTADTTQSQVVSDILAKGLSVKVNGTPWQRVILKMDEFLDEAIIILYGFMPSRQYDVELGILPGEASVRGQITTDTEVRTDTALPDTLPEQFVASSPEGSSVPLSSSPPRAANGTHTTNGHLPSPITLEERRLQLTHTLSLLTAEHSSLTSSLKSARKESQKADAALRSEIDTLKRASDRHVAGESRARKKVLALQEAVKQTLAAAHGIEAPVQLIECALPAMEERKAEVEREWAKVKEDAARARAQREEAEQREKMRAEAMQAELASLVNRLEKLNSKKEKLEGEGGVLAELEEKLRMLEEERERVEKDPYGYEGDAAADSEDSGPQQGQTGDRRKDDSSPDSDKPHHTSTHQNHLNPHPHANFHPPQHTAHPRKRHSHPMQHHQHHPRPSFPPRSISHQDPIRPSAARSSFPPPTHVPGVIHLQQQQHGPLKTHARVPFRPPGQGSSSASGAATPGLGVSNAASLLSSRAPPFEPGRGRPHSHPPGQAQQMSMSMQGQALASVAAKSELNPGSTPFAPRAAVVQAVGSNVVGAGRAAVV